MLYNIVMYHVICSFDKIWYKSVAFYKVSRPDTRSTQPSIWSVPEAYSSEVNQPRCKANLSPPSSAILLQGTDTVKSYGSRSEQISLTNMTQLQSSEASNYSIQATT